MRESNAAKPLGSHPLALGRCRSALPGDHRASAPSLPWDWRAASEGTAQTFAQIKRDADDLCQALAAAEAAIAANDRGMPLRIYREQPGNPPHVPDEDAC